MGEKISVIIPVHNADEYLDECIKSVVSQDYKNIELLIIDDGTSPDSYSVYEKYSKECKEIYVIEGKQDGPAKARNRGLERAAGDYIAFVDADDYLPTSDVLSVMLSEIKKKEADVAVGNYERLWKGKLLPAAAHRYISCYECESKNFRFNGFFSVGTLSYVWGKLYRTSFIKKNNIRFDDFNYAEDKLLNYKIYLSGAKYSFVNNSVYVYRKNETSISHRYRADSVESWMAIANNTQSFIEEKNLENKYGDLVAYTIFFAAFFDGKMNYEYKNKSMKAVKDVLRAYAAYPLAKNKFKELSAVGNSEKISSLMWRFMIWGFALAMRLKCYGLLAFGIKLLIDLRIDERLSDTGKRE